MFRPTPTKFTNSVDIYTTTIQMQIGIQWGICIIKPMISRGSLCCNRNIFVMHHKIKRTVYTVYLGKVLCKISDGIQKWFQYLLAQLKFQQSTTFLFSVQTPLYWGCAYVVYFISCNGTNINLKYQLVKQFFHLLMTLIPRQKNRINSST